MICLIVITRALASLPVSLKAKDPFAGRCGPKFGGRHCDNGCCSKFDWCSTGKAWCGCPEGCNEAYGRCGTDSWWQHKEGTHVCPPDGWFNGNQAEAQKVINAGILPGSPDGARKAMWALVVLIPQTSYEEVDSTLQEMKKLRPADTLTENAVCLMRLHQMFPLDSLPSLVDGIKRLRQGFKFESMAVLFDYFQKLVANAKPEEHLTFSVVTTTLVDMKTICSDDCSINDLLTLVLLLEGYPDLQLKSASTQLKLLKTAYGTYNIGQFHVKMQDFMSSQGNIRSNTFQDLVSLLMKIRQKTACKDRIYEVLQGVTKLRVAFPSTFDAELANSVIETMNAYFVANVQPVADALTKCKSVSKEEHMRLISTELISFRNNLNPKPTLQAIVDTISGLEKEFGKNYPSLQALLDSVMAPLSALQQENKMAIDTVTADIETLRVFQSARPVTVAELTDGARVLEEHFNSESFVSIVQACVEIAGEIPSLAFQDLVASTKAFPRPYQFRPLVKAAISIKNTFPSAPFNDVITVLKDLAGISSQTGDLVEDAKWFNAIVIRTEAKDELLSAFKKLQDLKSHWNIDGPLFLDSLTKLIAATPQLRYTFGSAREDQTSLDEALLSLRTDSKAMSFLADVNVLISITEDFHDIESLTPVARWLAKERSVASLEEGARALSLLGKANYRKHYDTFEDFLHHVDLNFGLVHAAWPSVPLVEYAQVLNQISSQLASTELITMDHLVDGLMRMHAAFPEVSFQTLAHDLPRLSEGYVVHFMEMCEDMAQTSVSYEQLVSVLQQDLRGPQRVWKVALADASSSSFFYHAYRIVFWCAIVVVILLLAGKIQPQGLDMRSYAMHAHHWSVKHFEQWSQGRSKKYDFSNDIYGTFDGRSSSPGAEMSVLL